ncbi:MAG: glycosyltransferase, partial [Acidobacteria bacterium]|nr:glycosyltransferase [Acidobacteriota bacterium]
MRIAIDLYACQTGSHLRGIGRYVKDWSLAMAGTTPADDQAFYLANGTLDQDFERVRRFLTPHVSPGQLKPYFHPAHLGQFQSGTRYREASALITQAYSLLDPDWLVVPSWMEGFGHPGLVPDLDNLPNSTRKAAILYDLIPLIFEAQYLPKHLQSFRDFYLKRLESLRELDLYLALSEATKRDAVTYLGLDPARIHVIYAGVSNQFQPRFYSEPEALRMGQHLGISKPFIFYVGNVDYRKNMHGAIQAFAKLPSPLRRSHQLVLNAVAEPHTFIRQLEQLGLNRDQVVLTGHISDTELVFLYNRCSVFFLP